MDCSVDAQFAKKKMRVDPTTVFDLFRYLNQLLAKISHCGPAISGVTVYPSQVDLAINPSIFRHSRGACKCHHCNREHIIAGH